MLPNTHTGKLTILARSLSPLHHGAGVAGNTAVLRKQDVLVPMHDTISTARVAFISGQSVKHAIRDAGVRHALRAMGVQPGSLDKATISLLFSGGNLSAKGTGQHDLGRARRIAELMPILSICGYACGASIEKSQIMVDHMMLVCAETAHLLRDDTRDRALPYVQTQAHIYQGKEFGTRQEALRDPQVRALLNDTEVKRIEAASAARASKEEKASDQMIYDFEVVKAGATWEGGLHYFNLSDMELAALGAAFGELALGSHTDEVLGRGIVCHLGAKSAVGFGKVALFLDHSAKIHPQAPQYHAAEALVKFGQAGAATSNDERADQYMRHLAHHRDEILSYLASVAA
jgi:hypothetical protein